MFRTCLNLHSAADFTETHIAVSRYRQFIRFSTLQIGEFARRIGWVALLNFSHAVCGSGHIELHSLYFLPVQVSCTRSTLQVHSNAHGFARPLTTTVFNQSPLSSCLIEANRKHLIVIILAAGWCVRDSLICSLPLLSLCVTSEFGFPGRFSFFSNYDYPSWSFCGPVFIVTFP